MASCTSETALNPANNPGNNNGEGVVRLTIGGSAGSPATKAAIAATDEEKAVKSLYAVLFTDASVAADGTVGGEDDAKDTFSKVIDLTDKISDGGVSFKVSVGSYQIVFVSNPGENLLDEKSLSGKTVGDFKALVETRDPGDKTDGMLMTSEFYGAAVTADDTVEIGAGDTEKVVELTRAMSRVDIVNRADGVTVTEVTFNNRAVKTDLINDGGTAIDTDYIENTATTYALNLAGDSNATDGTNAYKAEIYSYEQYGEDGNAPSLTVRYKIGEDTYAHEVKFRTVTRDDANTNKVLTAKKSEPSSYPAFNLISSFNDKYPAPRHTTGWYVPSYGELIDVVDALGGVSVSSQIKNLYHKSAQTISNTSIAKNINKALSYVGSGNYDTCDSTTASIRWHSSTECSDGSNSCTLNVVFRTNGLSTGYGQKDWGNVRYVLAF